MDIKYTMRRDGTTQNISGGNYTITEIADGFTTLSALMYFIAENPEAEEAVIDMAELRGKGINISTEKLEAFLFGYGVDYEQKDGSASGCRLVTRADWTEGQIIVSGWQRDDLRDFLHGKKTLTKTMKAYLDEALDEAQSTDD